MKKPLLFTVLLTFFTALGFAQSDKFWRAHSGSISELSIEKAVTRLSFPADYKLFDINFSQLSNNLYSITGANALSRTTVISLPNADGILEQFKVVEASNFEPALQARFPQIRSFSGQGITDKSTVIRFSLAPNGIQTMIFRADKGTEFMEPFTKDHNTYAVYNSQRKKGSLPWTCSTQDQEVFSSVNQNIPITHRTSSDDGVLRVIRLAQSCNGEYANFFGASSAGTPADTAIVLAAFNATLTRCNGVYEKDLALHLNLIPETGNVIFFDPATDPYTSLGQWNTQLQNTLNSNVGNALYDIGHMFGASGGGGNAGCIGCVCVDGTKGRGITSPADGIPMGDNFDIDYVVHEIGHQLGANHTFSHSSEGSGVNKEVGSGVTIMGYAGITSYDVAPHSLDIYHEASIEQIQTNLATKTCPVVTNISGTNATPVVASIPNRIIPISTPFALNGSATDANTGDVLTYCWEQNDDAGSNTGANSNASPTKVIGPNFITVTPTVSGTRLFPRLSSILAGQLFTNQIGGDAGMRSEYLSSVSRNLNFRLTVRDNSLYSSVVPLKVGQTAFTDMVVTVSNTSGPFAVTAPNTNVTWPSGSTQTITWDVNNTTAAPVSCANVKISMSTDGGLTFPTVLAANTANDGSEALVIPGSPTTTARIKIEAVDNIFFDISNTNFIISAPVNGFSFGQPAPVIVACGTATPATITITSAVTGTFVTPIAITYTSVPAGPVVTFTPNPLVPGTSTIATITNAAILQFGTYAITVTGTAGAVVQTTTINFTVSPGTGPVFTLQPIDQPVCAGSPVTFSSLATGALNYQWQVSTTANPAFTNIPAATNATYTIANPTVIISGNKYRVIATGQCNTTTSSAATLTVNTTPAITTQPTAKTVCAGTNAVFTVAATGSNLTYQWQVSSTAVTVFTDIPGANAASYTTTAVSTGQNGNKYRVVVSGTCPAPVTSNPATLTVGDAAAITLQPAPQAVCAPANATFTVNATGTSLTYQWQVSTDAGITFTDIIGATSTTYITAVTTPAMNGYLYRIKVFSCTPTGITSNNALLTVNTPIALSASPADVTVCQGTSTSFSVTAAGTGATYQWQYSASGCGGTFSNVSGAISAIYTIAIPTTTNNGGYRVVVTGTCGAVTSSCATLLVNTPIVITTAPQSQAVCIPNVNSANFNVAVTGTAPGYQWQISTNGGTTFTNIAGATSATYTLTTLAATQNNNQYRVIATGTCSTAGVTSAAATLTVNTQVAITSQPQSVKTCMDQTATFFVGATGSTITYQWQVSVNSGPYVNLENDGNYSGVNTATLTVSNLNTSLSGNKYRVIVSGVPCGSVTSTSAEFIVNAKPTVVIRLASYSSINPYIRTGLFTTISPVGSYSFKWYKNGVLIPSITASNFPITIDKLGEYSVIVTNDATGCTATSNKITVKDSADNKTLFVYPNPNRGSFQVRFYNQGTTSIDRTIMVYDGKGTRVFSQKYSVAGPYGKMDVNLGKITGAGTYLIDVRNSAGKRIASSQVIIMQ